MAPMRQAVVLLFSCILFISAKQSEKTVSELNEYYRPQIWSLLDYLNGDPYRDFNYRIYKYINSAQKTDKVTELEIEVGADCLVQDKCSHAVLVCGGYVEYFSDTDTYRTLPGAKCDLKWHDSGNGIPSVPESNDDDVTEKVITAQTLPCLGCPQQINNNAEGIDSLVKLALQHIESERDKKHFVVEIVSVHRQIVAGVKFILIAKIAPTLCPNDANLINAELCPVDDRAVPEYCRIEFFQKPTFSSDDHIISNNCTSSQEFTPKKFRDDLDNEINGYQKPTDPRTDGPNFEQIAQSGNLDGMTPERLAAVEAQIIPTDSTRMVPSLETTKSVIDNSQLGVDDIPSVQTSTFGMPQYGGNQEYVTELQRNDDLQQKSMPWNSRPNTEDTGIVYPDDSYEDLEKRYRTKRQEAESQAPKDTSEESSEEANKAGPVSVVKRQVEQTPPQSSESQGTSEELGVANKQVKRQAPSPKDTSEESSEEANKAGTASVVKRQVHQTPPQSSESQDTSEELGAANKQVKRQAPSPKDTSEESSEEVNKAGTAPVVKREVKQTPPQSSESQDASEELGATNKQVKRQAPVPKDTSEESSEEANKAGTAPVVKRQVEQTPPQSSESQDTSEEIGATNKQVKRQAPPNTSESDTSEEVTKTPSVVQRRKREISLDISESSESLQEPKQDNLERHKRAPKDSSSSSSSSSEEDKKNNNNDDDDDNGNNKKKNDDDDDDDDNGKHKKKHNDDDNDKGKHKKKHGKNKNDDDDDDNGNGKKCNNKNGDDNNGNGKDSSSSSSSSDEDDNCNNRKRRATDDSSSSSSDDDDDKNGNNDNGNHNNDNGKNKDHDKEGDDNNTSSSSSDDDDNNGKNRKKRAVASSSSSSSSDEDNDNGNTGNNHKENNKKENDDTSSSSSSDEDDDADKKNRGKREVSSLVKPNSDEKLIVRKVAEFAAKSFDDETYMHKLLEIENVKKLAAQGTIYHIRIRVGVWKCLVELCGSDGEKLCKLKVYVSPSGIMEINKSHCHKIISEADKNRTDRFFDENSGEVDATTDKEVMRIVSLTPLETHTLHPDYKTKFPTTTVLKATKRIGSITLYKIKVKFGITDCSTKCAFIDNSARLCEISAWVRDSESHVTNVTCEGDLNSRSKRQVLPGGISPVEDNNDEIKELMRIAVLELDQHTPHQNKYKVLNIIESSKQTVQGILYRVKANLILSDCLKTDSKESHECGQLQNEAPKICDIEIWNRSWLDNGKNTTISCGTEQYNFLSQPKHKLSKRQIPGGVSDARQDQNVIDLTKSSLLLADTRSPHDNKFKVVEILKATKQVTSGISYKIKATVVISDCPKNDNREPEQCGQLESDTPRLCDISILDKAWLGENGKETTVNCGNDTYHFPSGKLAKRSIPGGISPVDSKDEEINALMHIAVLELDPHTPHQNKYKVLNVIKSSRQVVQGILYRIKANLILSDCAKIDEKEAHECGQLQSESPKTCDITIWNRPWLDNGKNTTIICGSEHYNFLSQSGHKLSKRQLVGAPNKADEKKVQELLHSTMVELDSRTPHNNKYKVVNVINSTSQVVSGSLFKITAEMALSDCLKTDSKEYHECGLLTNSIPEVCNIEIWDQPWLVNGRKTTIKCPSEKYTFNTNSKRRTKRQVGAKKDVSLDDQSITDLTKSTLLYLDSRSPHDVKYKILEILDAKKQIVSGTKYYIKAKIILSDCKKYDSKDPVYCSEQKSATPRICDIKIWDQPWERHGRKTNITCDTETYQFRTGRSSGNLLGQDNHDFHYTMFKKFMKDHKKHYKTKDEHKYRFRIFMENMKKIEVLEKNEQGTGMYGPTKFADLTEEEFRSYLGYRPNLRAPNEIPFAHAEIPDIELPKEFDWREKNAVTEVKNQQQCGSCWAFSVTGNVEGQYALKYGKLLEFSEQELVDCDTMDSGCNGGLMDNAYRAIEKMGGLELESDYPYDARDEKCHFNNSLSRVKLSGALNISHDETDMAKWLVKNGPISIAINANAMQFYMGGVSHPLKFLCSPGNLDHGVLIVGYGVHKYPLFNRTLPYWIVKNSWGTSWGEQGYYRVFRGDGTCGLNQTPSSAIVA